MCFFLVVFFVWSHGRLIDNEHGAETMVSEYSYEQTPIIADTEEVEKSAAKLAGSIGIDASELTYKYSRYVCGNLKHVFADTYGITFLGRPTHEWWLTNNKYW